MTPNEVLDTLWQAARALQDHGDQMPAEALAPGQQEAMSAAELAEAIVRWAQERG